MRQKHLKSKTPFEILAITITSILGIIVIIPFVLLIISSLTDNKTLDQYGYSFWPRKFSLDAYSYLMTNVSTIGRAYGITLLITAVGVCASLIITSMLAYPLSRKDYPLRGVQAFLVFFTMIFNGGLVPTYLIYTTIFHIKNTLFGLLIPGLLMSGFYIMIMKTYFASSIPHEIIESGHIDGAGEFKVFYSIVLPISLPILATVGLLVGVNYWNDWFNGLIYITNPKLFSIQNLLNRMLQDIQFLQATAGQNAESAETLSKIPTTTIRMAIAVIGSLPVLVVYPFFQKYFAKGMTMGAVKG